MSKSDKLSVALTSIAIAVGFLVGGPAWGMTFLVLGVIFLVSFVFHESGDLVTLGDIVPVTLLPPTACPAVDFEFRQEVPEPAPGIFPRLLLRISNRGSFAITDLTMRATEYTLKNRNTIVNSMRAAADTLRIAQVDAKSSTQEIDILTLPQLLFEMPARERGVLRQIVDERYYALRFSFIDAGSQKRYCFYKIISCDEPYLLLVDSPYGFGWSKGLGVPDATVNNVLFGPLKLILANQRLIYQTHPEEEYGATVC